MAKRLVSVAVIAFFIVAVAQARTTIHFPETGVSDRRIVDSDAKATIFLPSQNPDLSSDADSSAPTATKSDVEAAEEKAVTAVPLTMLNFRPINRHIQRQNARRFWFPFPFPHHCHHHHRFMPTSTRLSALRRDAPYGDDMILAEGDGVRIAGFRSGGSRSGRWVSFRHGRPAFPYGHRHHYHHRHFRTEEVEGRLFRGEERERETEERKDGGIMNSIRKFLNQF